MGASSEVCQGVSRVFHEEVFVRFQVVSESLEGLGLSVRFLRPWVCEFTASFSEASRFRSVVFFISEVFSP